MNGSVLLDTNIVIALLAGEQVVVGRAAQALHVYLSSIVIGELFFGAFRSGRVEANLARLEQFATGRVVLPCDRVTARHYGALKQDLRTQGRPIPENDLWIAAIARQCGLTLVSRDTHFTAIAGLNVEQW